MSPADKLQHCVRPPPAPSPVHSLWQHVVLWVAGEVYVGDQHCILLCIHC
jgi:hypothetical protein